MRDSGGTIRAGKRATRARQFFILLHYSTNFKIKQYHKNESRFDGIYSRKTRQRMGNI